MTPNELRALADALHDASASLNGTHFVAARKAAAYLRAQAEAQPVAIVGEQRSGAWAGADTPAGYVWSPPSDSSTKMIFPLADLPLDTKLYTHPAPAVPQAEPDDDDALVLGEPDMLTPEDVRRLVPQAEPKRGLTCLWSRADDDTDVWETSCRHAFTLIDGTPGDNHMEFCCYCGRPLEQEIGDSDAE